MSTYTGVTNFQKIVRFLLAHPVYMCFGKCVDRLLIFRMSNECVTLSGSGAVSNIFEREEAKRLV